MSDLFLQSCALYLWLAGDAALKLFFLILLIHIHYRGQRLPHPHVWILDGIRKMMSHYRMKRWQCFNCMHQHSFNIWETIPTTSPCYRCGVSHWFLWRKPSGWETKDE